MVAVSTGSTIQTEYVPLAVMSAPFGKEGWIRLKVFSDDWETHVSATTLYINTGKYWYPIEFDGLEWQSKGYIAKIPGSDTRDQARAFTGREIGIKRADLPQLNNGDYYWSDLIGLTVVDFSDTDKVLGIVKGMLETGSNDVLVIRDKNDDDIAETTDHQKDKLLPFQMDVAIKRIDLEAKKIYVDWDFSV